MSADNSSTKTVTILAGVAAVALAGYMLFKGSASGPGKKPSSTSSAAGARQETEELVEAPTFLFIDPAASQAEKERQIMAWVKEQVDNVLGSLEEGKLSAAKGVLAREDYADVSVVVENRIKVALFQEKAAFNKERKALLDAGKFTVEEYLDLLVSHMTKIAMMRDESQNQVLDMFGISEDIYEASYETHTADEENDEIDRAFVTKAMTHFYVHPIKNGVSKDEDESTRLFVQILETVMDRFEQDDALDKFPGIQFYLQCVDQAGVDQAAAKGLTEADYRALILNHDSAKQQTALTPIYERIKKDIGRQLHSGEYKAYERYQTLSAKVQEDFHKTFTPAADSAGKIQEVNQDDTLLTMDKDATLNFDEEGIDGDLTPQANFNLQKKVSVELVKNVLKDPSAKKLHESDASEASRRFRLSVDEFTRSADASSGDQASVFVQVQGSRQTFETTLKAPDATDKKKTVWNETKEFDLTATGTSVTVTVQDKEQDEIGMPHEVFFEDIVNQGTVEVSVVSGARENQGKLTLSGQWTQ